MKNFTEQIFPQKANNYTALVAGIITGIGFFTIGIINQFPEISGDFEEILFGIIGCILISTVFLYVIGKEFFQAHAISGWLGKNYFGDTGFLSVRAIVWLFSAGLFNSVLRLIFF